MLECALKTITNCDFNPTLNIDRSIYQFICTREMNDFFVIYKLGNQFFD